MREDSNKKNRNESRDITTDTTKTQSIIKAYSEQLYCNELDKV